MDSAAGGGKGGQIDKFTFSRMLLVVIDATVLLNKIWEPRVHLKRSNK